MTTLTTKPIIHINWNTEFVDRYNESKTYTSPPVTRLINARRNANGNLILSILQRDEEDNIVDKVAFTYAYDNVGKCFKVINSKNRYNSKTETMLNLAFHNNYRNIIQSLENHFNKMMNKVITDRMEVMTSIKNIRTSGERFETNGRKLFEDDEEDINEN